MKIKEVDKKLVLKDGETGTVNINLSDEEVKEPVSHKSKIQDKKLKKEEKSSAPEKISGKAKHSVKKKNPNGEKTSDHFYFDVLLVLGMLLYLFTQTAGFEIYGRECEAGTVFYGLFMILSMISLSGPLLIFMVSGARLLAVDEPIKDIWLKRIIRMGVVLLIFTILYYISDIMAARDEFDIWTFIGDLYCKERVTPLEYLYAYIGFLICLPFLRPMARNMKNADFLYLIVIGVVLQFLLPEVDAKICKGRYMLNPNFNLNWLIKVTIIYPLAGYYLHHRVSREQIKKFLAAIWIVCVIGMSVIIYNTNYHTTYVESVAIYTDYLYWVNLVVSIAIFMTVKLIHTGHDHKEGISKVMTSLAGCSFGIYLLFPAVLDRIKIFDDLEYMIFGDITGPVKMLPSLLWILVVYLICLIPIWLIRRIPFTKKVI